MRAPGLGPTTWAALCALVVSSLAGANPQPSSMPAPDIFPAGNADADSGTDAGSGFDNLEIVDAGLTGKMTVLRVGSESSANNLLSVFAGLKNKTAHRFALEVETIYRDKDGNALNAGSWIPITLKPHEEREYRSTSISEEAVDFLIRVRLARAAPPASSPK